jgi:hypothetical protein
MTSNHVVPASWSASRMRFARTLAALRLREAVAV